MLELSVWLIEWLATNWCVQGKASYLLYNVIHLFNHSRHERDTETLRWADDAEKFGLETKARSIHFF